MNEIWRDIAGYEGLYQVSSLGRIKSLRRYKQNHGKLQLIKEQIKSCRIDNNGYLVLDLYRNNKPKTIRVHRLVAGAFVDNLENKKTVNHIDGDKTNNCVENLEWATSKEQTVHVYDNELKSKQGIKRTINAMTKATSKPVKCLNTGRIYTSVVEAAREMNISSSFISRCCRGKCKSAGKDKNQNPLRWKYV